jgi:hypothetical protein
LSDDERPRLIERARGGDWDAIEDLVAGAIAPTFDAALHLLGDAALASQATEDALLALLLAVRKGEIRSEDPLIVSARSLSAAAQASGSSPFSGGLGAEDLVTIERRLDDPRRSDLGKIAAADRIAAVLAFSLDLAPEELGPALGRAPADLRSAIDGVLDSLPHEQPEEAFRAILDARASRARVPLHVEDRVLDRFEKAVKSE